MMRCENCYGTLAEMLANKDKKIAELTASNNRLREALTHADEFISNGIEFGFIRMPDDDLKGIDSAHDTPEIISKALSLTPAQSLAEHDNEVTAPYKKALEFAEYLAKSTEQFMIAINQLDAADQEEDEETVEIMQEKRGEHWRAVNSSIYEFRQRSDRALRASHD